MLIPPHDRPNRIQVQTLTLTPTPIPILFPMLIPMPIPTPMPMSISTLILIPILIPILTLDLNLNPNLNLSLHPITLQIPVIDVVRMRTSQLLQSRTVESAKQHHPHPRPNPVQIKQYIKFGNPNERGNSHYLNESRDISTTRNGSDDQNMRVSHPIRVQRSHSLPEGNMMK